MGNPFKAVDEFLEVFITDEFGRFIFNVIFWVLATFIMWFFSAWFGPLLFWFLILCFLPSLLFSLFLKGEPLWLVWGLGLILLFAVVGVPYVFYGYLMKLVMTKTFDAVYIWSIKTWWGFLNHLHPFSNADITWDMYKLSYQNLQIFFSITGLILPNIICSFLPEKEYKLPSYESDPMYYTPTPLTPEEEALKIKEDQIELLEARKAQAIREKALEEERQAEARARAEAERKRKEEEERRQKKIQEVRGKNPWDSGFL